MTGRLLAIGLGLIVLLGVAYAFWTLHNERVMHDGRVAALRSDLVEIRKAIRKYREDKGQNPTSLEELIPNYLRRIPIDPMTGDANWLLETEEVIAPSSDFTTTTAPSRQIFILDVHSAAGPPYSTY